METWNIAFSTSTKSHFELVKRKKEFPVPGDQLKHRFLDLSKVEFWGSQEPENDFKVPFEELNRRFIDLIKVEFWAAPEPQKYVERIMLAVVTSIFRSQPIRILRCSRGRK